MDQYKVTVTVEVLVHGDGTAEAIVNTCNAMRRALSASQITTPRITEVRATLMSNLPKAGE